MAKGFKQTHGQDYFENFAPVAKMTTGRLILALASTKRWHLSQIDVYIPFLYGDLQEDVYMDLPSGFQCPVQDNYFGPMVCKLIKSLYGLKQAPRQWFSKFPSVLLSYGFIQSKRG